MAQNVLIEVPDNQRVSPTRGASIVSSDHVRICNFRKSRIAYFASFAVYIAHVSSAYEIWAVARDPFVRPPMWYPEAGADHTGAVTPCHISPLMGCSGVRISAKLPVGSYDGRRLLGLSILLNGENCKGVA